MKRYCSAPQLSRTTRAPRPAPKLQSPILGNQARLCRLQAKLTNCAVSDPLEIEGAVAERVMRKPTARADEDEQTTSTTGLHTSRSEDLASAGQRFDRKTPPAPRGRDRCGAGEPCERDEARSRDLLGFAKCNTTTGLVDVTVDQEHCAGDCVLRHEQSHVRDDKACCVVYADCIRRAGSNPTEKALCREKWDAYASATEAFSECNAYTAELDCLGGQIAQNCGAGGKVGEACCAELRRLRDKVVTPRKTYYCGQPGAQVPLPCGLYFR